MVVPPCHPNMGHQSHSCSTFLFNSLPIRLGKLWKKAQVLGSLTQEGDIEVLTSDSPSLSNYKYFKKKKGYRA